MDPDTELTYFPLESGGIPLIENPRNQEEEADIKAPVLLSSAYSDSETYELIFNEALSEEIEKAKMEPEDSGWELSVHDNTLRLQWMEEPTPVTEYKLSLTVTDLSGNSNWFIIPFWTANPHQARLLLNEASPSGSGNNPDCLEYYCTAGGNLMGYTFYMGTATEHKAAYYFPDMDIEQGDFLILHCRPEGIASEINESSDKSASGGLLSSDNAWDIWSPEVISITGTNGILSLYSLPRDGELVDCLIYSNRESDREDEKLGWTSTVYKQLLTLEEGSWDSQGPIPTPAEAVWSDDTTGTRTLCRSSTSEDSNRPEDWHTVPTSGKTFGYINSDEVYTDN